MSNDQTTPPGPVTDDGLTTITIPRDKVHAVMDLLARLDDDDAEVSGYMMPGIGSFASRPMAANQKHATGTGCLSSSTGWKCSDIDRTPGDE